MISTSGVELVSSDTNDQLSVSKANLVSIAHLFASMTCADEKIMDIEKFTSEVFLDEYKPDEIQEIKQVYRNSIKNYGDKERNDIISNLVTDFTENQKIGLLRSLCAVAMCDGYVHPEEQYIIKSFMKQMGIDQFVDDHGVL